MGSTDEHNKPSTLEEERQRLRDFVTANDQITWMMRYQGRTVGAIWLTLDATPYLHAPSIHLMIGDPSVRGQGIGGAAIRTLVEQLKKDGQSEYLYSRHLLENLGSARLLRSVGFTEVGKSYQDEDGLGFQNLRLRLKPAVPTEAS